MLSCKSDCKTHHQKIVPDKERGLFFQMREVLDMNVNVYLPDQNPSPCEFCGLI